MKRNIIGWSILFINLIIVSIFILQVNANQLKINFANETENNFWGNYFFCALSLYYFYACNSEKLIKGQKLLFSELLKITLLSMIFSIILNEYGNVMELVIILNITVILFFYKQIRLLIIVIPIIFTLAFFSNKYFNYKNHITYTTCKTKNLSMDKMENCINEFTVYNLRTGTTRYLTKINIQLAKQNDTIKEIIQSKIIKQNEDESCKLNENYEVMQTKNKKGFPCGG